MLYRTMPATGDRLSILGYGCMRLPVAGGRIDEPRATRQIRHAIDSGVNYVDTAWPYHAGDGEPFVGRALAGGYREKVKLATKLPCWMVHTTADMDRFLNLQLERLNTTHIDYYLVHGLNGSAWERMAALGVLEFLERAQADGRIVNAGFSFHGELPDFKQIVEAHPWVFCQIQYNFLDEVRQAGTEGLGYAASKGLGVVVMQPLRGGMLGLASPPPAIAAILEEAGQGRTPAAWALSWVWDHPQVVVALSGMNDESQIEENLALASRAHPNSLGADELDVIARIARKYQEIVKVGCTGCGYCKPCPSGVAIPDCFDVYNHLYMFSDPGGAKFVYALRMSGMISGTAGYASQCSRCGDCIEKCPQFLQIPDLLEKVAEELEGPDLKATEAMVRHVMAIA
ncbi:MAG: aldo/keto reductase [Bryobacteraceae bacterium]|jgi:predicted aldo/keto reductase-like oxidoreductase